ncbi:alpha/beta hydrolase [Corynebacterium sp. ES2794-CONJ1]|uniref:alpha/beta hydrolase n=1 Tax=Corynebacterium sp. ES2794-CONJ1 TaxID=2980553 RepID=UPI0021D92550|nr:alpha/beta hydrolase [Corynebacterium sp. ES2794-CONJ1]MCU9519874.1 alpha/beta hydrolase [Corynebacterium sp. ES2794-CONJ1]
MNATSTQPMRYFGHTIIDHRLEVPWDPSDKDSDTFTLFAREIYADENLPAMVYFQGGPGFPAPRPVSASGWLSFMLKHYRLILLDQRGTGYSHRIDAASDPRDRTFERLVLLRQENIIADAEALREYLGIDQWSVMGQSYGGFCIHSYYSLHPEVIDKAYLTGGIPAIHHCADEVYTHTYRKLAQRHKEFYRHIPWAESRIREIAYHLDNSEEILPTGERLSSRRFRTIGINLGRGSGFMDLAWLLEEPFHIVRGEKRLRRDVLDRISAQVSFEQGPLYGAIHESIYAGVGGLGATKWSAERMRNLIDGFAEDLDPITAENYYLTGEHIYPWQFDEDPALQPFKEAAEKLAHHEFTHSPYNPEILAGASRMAAAVYVDDIFVPFELSLATAHTLGDMRMHMTNYYQHDGLREDGAKILEILHRKLLDH